MAVTIDPDSGLPVGLKVSPITPPKIVTTPETLDELFDAHGVTREQAARGAGFDPLLLERVINGRQALAIDLVVSLAAFLGVGRGDVMGCAGRVGAETGPRAHVALPPEPLLGELFPTFPLAETVNHVPGSVPLASLMLWVCGDGIGGSGGIGAPPGVVRIERNAGLIRSRTSTPITLTPVELATDGHTVFTGAAQGSHLDFSVARLLPATGELLGETVDGDFNQTNGLVYEPESGTLWGCEFGSPQLVQIDTNTGAVVATVRLSYSSAPDAPTYSPRDVVAVHGLLYVTGTYDPGAGPNDGRVFEVDPVTRTILRISTGSNLQYAWGIATDGVDLWVTGARKTSSSVGVYAITIAKLIAAVVTISADPTTIADPTWIEYFFKSYWITDVSGDGARLIRVDSLGVVVQSRLFGGTAGGHCTADPWFLWYADKANGSVHLLNPSDISASQVVVVTGGAPDGLLVV